MLKPGKSQANNFQALFKSWKQHYSLSILAQSTYQPNNYFFCSVPADQWKYCHGPHCSNKQFRRKNNQKLKLETLVCSVGANLQTTIHAINCSWIEGLKSWEKYNRFSSNTSFAKNH